MQIEMISKRERPSEKQGSVKKEAVCTHIHARVVVWATHKIWDGGEEESDEGGTNRRESIKLFLDICIEGGDREGTREGGRGEKGRRQLYFVNDVFYFIFVESRKRRSETWQGW